MTPLRQRMLEDMQLRGFSPRTQEAYVHAVRQLATHFRRPPDQLREDELREYFLYLTNVKHFAPASFTIALCGIKFFYERTLSREWKLLELVRPVREKKLPVILSRDEVRRILGAVRLPVYRALSFATTPSGRHRDNRGSSQPLRHGEEKGGRVSELRGRHRQGGHTTRRGGAHRRTVGAGCRALVRVAGQAKRSYAARRTYR